MQQVTPTGARLLAPPKPLPPAARPAPAAATADFARAVHTAAAGAAYLQPDVIDVEVLWEDAEEAYAPQAATSRSSYRQVMTPLRLAEPGVALAAYRSAATTSTLPHSTIDLFA